MGRFPIDRQEYIPNIGKALPKQNHAMLKEQLDAMLDMNLPQD